MIPPLISGGLVDMDPIAVYADASLHRESFVHDSDLTSLIALVIMLAIDIAIIIIQGWPRNSSLQTPLPKVSSHQQLQPHIEHLTTMVRQVQDDFCHLERQLCLQQVQEEEQELARIVDSMFRTFVRSKPRLGICERPSPRNRRKRRRLSNLCNGYKVDALDTTRMSGAFTLFCERLLATNRIWKQERKIRELQSDTQSDDASRRSRAFAAFCSKLLLYNKIWQLEKQVRELEVERAKMTRRFEATVRRAAKKMMQDLEHDRLIEGHVKDMIAELDGYKLALFAQHALHEQELKEVTWDWHRDYRKLVREVETLHLAQRAKSIQQDLENDHEESLYESLIAVRRRAEELEMRLEEYQHTLVNPSIDDDVTEHDHESVSMISTTCVSFDGQETGSPLMKSSRRLSGTPSIPRRARSASWVASSQRREYPIPKGLLVGSHSGFSFNPLFYGPNVSPLGLRPLEPLHEIRADKPEGERVQKPPIAKQKQAGSEKESNRLMGVRWRI
ncbi:hypothetical protein AX17_005047 [Amanita inopinata Kibby_2008]|nr:hypothetical protein AX17_005047 [Amanita inopinata Kibby_2008]